MLHTKLTHTYWTTVLYCTEGLKKCFNASYAQKSSIEGNHLQISSTSSIWLLRMIGSLEWSDRKQKWCRSTTSDLRCSNISCPKSLTSSFFSWIKPTTLCWPGATAVHHVIVCYFVKKNVLGSDPCIQTDRTRVHTLGWKYIVQMSCVRPHGVTYVVSQSKYVHVLTRRQHRSSNSRYISSAHQGIWPAQKSQSEGFVLWQANQPR